MAENISNNNDSLICPICRSTFIHPKSLPVCEHSFCESCIRKYAYMNGYSQKGELPCPSCGEVTPIPENGVSGFDDNKGLISRLQVIVSKIFKAPQPQVREHRISQSDGGNKGFVDKSQSDGRNKGFVDKSQSDGRNKGFVDKSQSDGRNKDFVDKSSRCSTTVTEMELNKADVDILSAREWAIFNETQIKSGATLQLKNLSEAITMSGDDGSRILVIKGTIDSASRAVQIIQQTLEDSVKFDTLLVPRNALGRIYGRQGGKIKFITHKSGAKIEINKSNPNEMIEVVIKGDPQQVALAKDLIQQTVDGVNVLSINDRPTIYQRDSCRPQHNEQYQGNYMPQNNNQCQGPNNMPKHNKQCQGPDYRRQHNNQGQGNYGPQHTNQGQGDYIPQHNNQCQGNYGRQHTNQGHGNYGSQHNNQCQGNYGPQYINQCQGNYGPQHNSRYQENYGPQNNIQYQGNYRPQYNQQYQGHDYGPQHNKQSQGDYRPQHNKKYQGDRRPQHSKQCQGITSRHNYVPKTARNITMGESGPIPGLMKTKTRQDGRNTAEEPDSNTENEESDVSRETVLEVIVPHKAVGSVIGKQGVQIKQICTETGAKLRFKDTLHNPDQDDDKDMKMSILLIHGSDNSVDRALEVIRKILRPFIIIFNLADHEMVIKRECVVELDIPKKMISTVTGRKWMNIRQTEQKTGARMYLPERQVTSRGLFIRRMVIRGTSEATRQAEEIIRKLMADVSTEQMFISVHTLKTMFGDLKSDIGAISRLSHDNARITVSSEGDDNDPMTMKLITITGLEEDAKTLKGLLTELVDSFEAEENDARMAKELEGTDSINDPELIQPEPEVIEHKTELFECGCCFDDEVEFEEMGQCNDGHLFCRMCITRYCEEIMGQGRSTFPCLGADCEEHFPPLQLQTVLQSPLREGILKIIQAEELRQADIPDLVTCPHCPYAVIMPDESDTVLQCENSDCLKQTCRLCKEPNHLPLRCNQVEKPGETNMRTYVENKMTDALVRKCPRCDKRFYKVEGCNHMTCPCGASMCYVCRQPISATGDHFGHAQCQQYTDVATLHEREVRQAGENAKQSYVTDHPEASGIDLIFDPLAPNTAARSTSRR